LDENFDADSRIYKVLVSKQPETVKIGGKTYENCLHITYRRDRENNSGDRFFDRYRLDSVWYAPNVGIVKMNHAEPMYNTPTDEGKSTYYLADYNVVGEGIGNQYMPLAQGNYWNYRAAGDNTADETVCDYINRFTVEYTKENEASLSHIAWLCEK
jgi:hypothetical protein